MKLGNLLIIILISSCTSTPVPSSKKNTPKESSSVQSTKDERYKQRIADLEKKVQELEKQKKEPIEVEPPQEVSQPKEVSAPKEVSTPKASNAIKLEGSKTVTTVGKAYLGSDITLEEAKIIALTDAQSIALNKLGVFVEASQTVQDFRLTQDEVLPLQVQ